MSDLGDRLEQVRDRQTFLQFVRALMIDYDEMRELDKQLPPSHRGIGANGWANYTVGPFLEAALACVEAKDERLPAEASWRAFAEFLYMGMIYE